MSIACGIEVEKEERSNQRAADSCWLEKKFAECLASGAVREHLLELVLAEKEKCGEVVTVLKCESRIIVGPISGELEIFRWRSMDVSGKLLHDDQKQLADAGYPSAWNENKLGKVLTNPHHCELREMVEALKKLGIWCFDVTRELKRLGVELMVRPQRCGSYEKLEMLAVDALARRSLSASFFLMLRTADLMSGLGEKIAVVGTLKHE